MIQNSHLAWRVPIALGVLALVTGCYTVFSHPQTEVQTADSQYSDCGSCHAAGFASPILPNPYTYVSTPFQNFYGTPWWLPEIPAVYGGGVVRDGDASKRTVSRDEEDGRHVGGRGALPPGYDPPGANPPAPPRHGTATGETETPTTTPGQQPGRTMKESSSEESSGSTSTQDSQTPAKKEEPKDKSGG